MRNNNHTRKFCTPIEIIDKFLTAPLVFGTGGSALELTGFHPHGLEVEQVPAANGDCKLVSKGLGVFPEGF